MADLMNLFQAGCLSWHLLGADEGIGKGSGSSNKIFIIVFP